MEAEYMHGTYNTDNTVSFTGWEPMDEDTLPHKLDQSWTSLTDNSGRAWAKDQQVSKQASGDVDEVPMEDEIDQSGNPTFGEMGNSGAPTGTGQNNGRPVHVEVNEGMPGFLSVGRQSELSCTGSINGISSGPSHNWQEDSVFTTPAKRTSNAPETEVCFIILLLPNLAHHPSS
jgi:hypothetical protein